MPLDLLASGTHREPDARLSPTRTISTAEACIAGPRNAVSTQVHSVSTHWKCSFMRFGAGSLDVTTDVTGLDDVAAWPFAAFTGYPVGAIINPMTGVSRRTADGRLRAQSVPYGDTPGYLRESVDGLHLAGGYTSDTVATHGAYSEARRVTALIRANH